MIRSHLSSGASHVFSDNPDAMPALLTRTSTVPNRASVASTIRRAPDSVAMSPTTSAASPPAFSTRTALSRPPRSSRSAITTLAPSSATRTAVARPNPELAPVTITILPSSLMSALLHRHDAGPRHGAVPMGVTTGHDRRHVGSLAWKHLDHKEHVANEQGGSATISSMWRTCLDVLEGSGRSEEHTSELQ